MRQIKRVEDRVEKLEQIVVDVHFEIRMVRDQLRHWEKMDQPSLLKARTADPKPTEDTPIVKKHWGKCCFALQRRWALLMGVTTASC